MQTFFFCGLNLRCIPHHVSTLPATWQFVLYCLQSCKMPAATTQHQSMLGYLPSYILYTYLNFQFQRFQWSQDSVSRDKFNLRPTANNANTSFRWGVSTPLKKHVLQNTSFPNANCGVFKNHKNMLERYHQQPWEHLGHTWILRTS